MFRMTPREARFFDMFVDAAGYCKKSADLLCDLMMNYDDTRDDKITQIERLEHDGDQQVHNILEQLNKSFITPIDREDIFLIAKELDNITDSIDSTAHLFRMLNVKSVREEAKQMVQLIVEGTKVLMDMMAELKNYKKSKELDKMVIQVNYLENEGDRIHRAAVQTLFANEKDVLEVIKWKDVYGHLEWALDSCEDVANIVVGVVMKHV